MALIERIKNSLFKKKPVPEEKALAAASASGPRSAATPVEPAQDIAAVNRLQNMSSKSSANMPVYNGGNDNGYQASRSGADATRRSHRPSSTLTKLQALSASGTGTAAKPAASTSDEDPALNSLLDRLEREQ